MGLTFARSAYHVRMSAPIPNFVTPVEYLELERQCETRNEYIAGRMFAKSGSNHRHNLIVGNLLVQLSSQMRGRACEAS